MLVTKIKWWQMTAWLAAVFLNSYCSIVSAAPGKTWSTLTVETGWDSEAGSDYYIEADLSSETGPQLLLAADSSVSATSTSETTTNSYLMGLYNNPAKALEFGVDYEYWGNSDELVTNTVRATLGWHRDNLSIRLRPQYRNITLYTRQLAMMNRRLSVDTSSTGLGIQFRYYRMSPLILSVGHLRNHYDANLSGLATGLLPRYIFSPTTLDLAYGFERDRSYVDISVDFKYAKPGVEWWQSRSAVDNSEVTVYTAYASKRLSKSWKMRLEAGRETSGNTTDDIAIAGLGFSYLW